MKYLISLILLWGTAALAQTASPVWFRVAAGGDTITAAKGTTLRYGMTASTYVFDYAGHKPGEPSPEAWSPAVTLPADATFVADEGFFGGDPLVDVYKEVDVQETAVAQTLTVTPADGSAVRTVIVPALPPTLTIKLDTAGVQFSSCIDKVAVDSNGDEYFVLICKNVAK